MRIIGITGPTGAGKTTALHALADLGAAVIDCDGVYHDLTENSSSGRCWGPSCSALRGLWPT